MPLPLLVTAYTRCSTDRQEMSVPDQLKLIRAYCEAKGYTLLYPDRYSDEGFSGTTFERRKGVMALISDVQSGKAEFERVIILNESRWGRPEDPEDSTYFELLIKRAGVAIEYVQGENHEGVVGRITRAIRYDQASGFSKQLGRDVLRGSKTVVEKGFSPGGNPPLGYTRMLYDAAGKPIQILKPKERKVLRDQKVGWVLGDKADVELIRRIFDLARHKSIKSICEILNKEAIKPPQGRAWEHTTVFYLLRNRAYIGERSYGGTKYSRRLQEKVVCPLAHEPIIDRELWEEVHSNMFSRQPGKKGNYQKSPYLLTSKLVCTLCNYNFFGKRLTGTKRRSNGEKFVYWYYQCSGYDNHRVCSSFLIRREPIEAFVLEAIREIISSEGYKEALLEALEEAKQERSQAKGTLLSLKSNLRTMDREIEKIQDELLQTPSKSLRARLLQREAQREALEAKIEVASRASKSGGIEETIRRYHDMIERFGKMIDAAPIDEKKRMVSYFLEKGEVDRERREVRFYFFRLPAAHVLTYPVPAASKGAGGQDWHEAAYKVMVYQIV